MSGHKATAKENLQVTEDVAEEEIGLGVKMILDMHD